MASLRNGQWCSTSTPIPGAHTTPDGRAIGIYQAASRPGRETLIGVAKALPTGEDFDLKAGEEAAKALAPNVTPECVIFCRENGENLMRLSDDGNSVTRVACSPDELEDLQPVIEADHIPESRRPHLKPGHKFDA